MAAVPELPLGQMVFFGRAKVSWGISSLFILLVLGMWQRVGVGGKYVDKRKPDKEECRPPESLCQDSASKVIYKIESPRMGRGFVTGAGMA